MWLSDNKVPKKSNIFIWLYYPLFKQRMDLQHKLCEVGYSPVFKYCTNCQSRDKVSDSCSLPLQSVLYLI